MDVPKKPKKFQTIAEFLRQNPSPKTKKMTMNSGKLTIGNKIVKWSADEDKLLMELMAKRTVSAIRRRLWDLFHRNSGQTKNQKLK